jgi:hypothetical protein
MIFDAVVVTSTPCSDYTFIYQSAIEIESFFTHAIYVFVSAKFVSQTLAALVNVSELKI